MNETITTATTASNRAGITSLILAFLAGVFLCLAEFSIGPARIMLLSLPAGVLSLGAVISGIVGLRQPARRWTAVVGLILGGILLLGSLCTFVSVPLATQMLPNR